MRQFICVFSNQRRLFFHDKGLLLFYLGLMLVSGIGVPLFMKNMVSALSILTFLTITLQKQWAAESITAEKDAHTIEPLLSSALSLKWILVGKSLFSLVCSVGFYLITLVCVLVVHAVTGVANSISPFSILLLTAAIISILGTIAFLGTAASAKATNTMEASRKMSLISYGLGFVMVIFSSLVIETAEEKQAVTIAAVLCSLFLIMIALASYIKMLHTSKISLLGNENHPVHVKKRKEERSKKISSQFSIVFRHEWRYFCTLKGLLLQFGVLLVSPAIILWIIYFYTGNIAFQYVVLSAIVLIPRISTNLIAFSIGGEKAYKTGETLLSTSLSERSIFAGKCALPLAVSFLILLGSGFLSVGIANLIAVWEGKTVFLFFHSAQVILLIMVGMAISTNMVFISTMLSLTAGNPRKGLYYSTILGPVFAVPVICILYFAHNQTAAAVCYFILLVILGQKLLRCLNCETRERLMSRL